MLLPQGYCALRPQLGLVVRAARRSERLKQAALAADVGTSRETLSRVESGERFPRPQLLDGLMAVLELDWEDVAVKGKSSSSRTFLDGYRGDQLNLIGKRVRDIRLSRGLNLNDMAKYLGTSAATLSRFERGQLIRSHFFRDHLTHAQADFESRPVEIVHGRLRALLA